MGHCTKGISLVLCKYGCCLFTKRLPIRANLIVVFGCTMRKHYTLGLHWVAKILATFFFNIKRTKKKEKTDKEALVIKKEHFCFGHLRIRFLFIKKKKKKLLRATYKRFFFPPELNHFLKELKKKKEEDLSIRIH